MKIALFCSSRNRIPPVKTGGTEQPIFYLARGLAEKGHKVTVYAARGSKIPGVKIKEISPFAIDIYEGIRNIQERISSFYDLMALADFFKNEAKKFDIIQFNSYIFYEILPFARYSRMPIIIRINYPHHLIYPYIKDYLKKFKFDNVYYLPISNFIKKIMPGLPYLEPIPPAVDMEEFIYSSQPKDYLLFIGRICADKGADIAVKVARKVKKKLILAGRITEQDKSYFQKLIKPYFKNKKIIYVGEVDFKTKIKLYQRALAILFPIRWDEPFGNVMIESMACGTPVIAFNRAAVREAVKNEVSGFIVKDGDINQIASAVAKIDKLDRQKVRKWAEDNFSLPKITAKYEETYKSVIGRKIIKIR